MVVTFLPAAGDTGVEQERTGCPSRGTVPAPHCAMPQPNLVPVRCSVAAALAGTFARAEASRLFSQELGEVTKDISVDLDYNSTATGASSVGLAAGLRIGAFGGEVLVNTKNALDLASSGFDTAGVGYKMVVAPHLAVYGILSYNKIDNPGPGP